MSENNLPICVLDIDNDPVKLIERVMSRLREVAHDNDLHVKLVDEWC